MNDKKIETGHFESFDGTRLFYRFFPSESDEWMMILHGHGEHSGRYDKFSSKLRDSKLSLAAFDFRGAGRSEGREVYVEHFRVYLTDITFFIEHMRKKHGFTGKPIMLAHSLGGLAGLYWAIENRDGLRGVILSSPCLGLKLPKFLIGMNELLNRVVPGMLYKNPVYPPHLSHNPEEIQAYKDDPLIKRKMSVRLLSEMIRAMKGLDSLVDGLSIPVPIFMLLAGLEKVVDGEKTRKIFDIIEAPLKHREIFSEFYHEIFNELRQDEAFNALNQCVHKLREWEKTKSPLFL